MISVIIPIYNIAEYLPKCIDSILDQDYKDWELILVDDGSTDDSGTVCDMYASKDCRIKVFHTKNGGASCARNIGLDMANGQWLTFVDGDDWVKPNYLSAMMNAAIESGSDMVIAGLEMGDIIKSQSRATLNTDNKFDFFATKGHPGFVCSKLIRADVIKTNSMRFSPNVPWAEDALFFYRLVTCYCQTVTFIPDVVYHYFGRPQSAAKRLHPFDQEFQGYIQSMELMHVLVDEYGLRIRQYFSPYTFLWRTIRAMYIGNIEKTERLKILRSLKFPSSWMRHDSTHWKESIIARLVINKQWYILDLLMSRFVKSI